MTPRCTICQNKRVRAIDRALLASGASVRSIAKQYSISEPSLYRHRKKCLASAIVEAAKQEREADITQAIGIKEQLQRIHREALAILEDAKADGDRRSALAALHRMEQQLALAARIADLVQDAPQMNVAVSINDSWPALRSVILRALEPHSEARDDVLAALEREARQ